MTSFTMNKFNLHQGHWTAHIFTITLILLFSLSVVKASPALAPPAELLTGCWAAYAPTNFAPPNYYPSTTQIGQDLSVLKSAGFTGIVTYGSEKVLGTGLPQVAHQKGLNLIMGIFNPASAEEYKNAKDAKDYVVGYVVGNEGLDTPPPNGYDRNTLETTIANLKADTGKPVTTSEQWGDYIADNSLLDVGDWVFPNVHPFFATPTPITDPTQAATWTLDRYDELDALTSQQVVFKEVGLPSAGGLDLSQANQAEYFRQLRWETHVKFVYFEAFDQPWKSYLGAFESHWGMFASNRSPKQVRQYVCGGVPNLISPTDITTTNNRPTFRWGSTGAAKYEMQLYTDTPPSQTVVNAPVLAYTPDCALLTRDYHWRVRAIDSLGNALDWSDIRDLTIQSAPNTAAPRNFYTIPTPALTWNRVASATQYEVQVGCNLSNPSQDVLLSPDTLSYTTATLSNGTYNWHVRAKNENDSWGSWSPTESFAVSLP